jgi:hypothetical protein
MRYYYYYEYIYNTDYAWVYYMVELDINLSF